MQTLEKASRAPEGFRGPEAVLTRLKQCTTLPTLPGVAMRIVDLANDVAASMADVAKAIGSDPALVTKILRVANSALHARQRRTENLRQALMLFGLDGTLTLALSFSLVRTLDGARSEGLDYKLFWRRSLAAATASRLLGAGLGSVTNEDLFLGGLLQDVGMLALARAMPEVYRGVRPLQADHGRVQSLETEALGIDHAQVGAWLLGRWDLPARWVTAVASSHDLVSGGDAESGDALSRCVAAAGAVADIWCSEHLEEATDRAAETCGRLLGTDNAELEGILRLLGTEMREGAEVFDVDIGDALLLESVSENARELLTTRTLQAEQAVLDLRQKASSLESRTRELEEANRRDKLTGLYNRGHLDQVLREEFAGARARGWPLSLVFVDLDHFKRVNDAHGHSAGDVVIKHAADILTESTRTADVVARYGGEEFVLLLVGTGRQGARRVCERVVGAFRGTAVTVEPSGTAIRVTASVGLAVQGEGVQYESAEDLLRAADGALYEAKNSGRDRMVCVGG